MEYTFPILSCYFALHPLHDVICDSLWCFPPVKVREEQALEQEAKRMAEEKYKRDKEIQRRAEEEERRRKKEAFAR